LVLQALSALERQHGCSWIGLTERIPKPRGLAFPDIWFYRYPGKNGQISISFLIVNYVPKLHVGLVGFVSLGTAAWVQLDRFNQEDSITGRVGIPGHPVL
jgi:hypothetical protein